MFVGVVVNNFQKVQDKIQTDLVDKTIEIRKEKWLDRLQKSLLESSVEKRSNAFKAFFCCRKTSTHEEEIRELTIGTENYWENYPKWRMKLYKIVSHRYFEYSMMGSVGINLLMMAMEHYKMPEILNQIIDITGYIFLALLTCEMILKIVAFGFRNYISDRWNTFDVLLIFISFAGFIFEESVMFNPFIVRIARVFRIARVIKLYRAATNLHKILDTISQAIPQVINLSLLFILLFFIYASLGVQLYGTFDCHYEQCDGLSRNANFKNFGMALLTLFRIFTGDNWNLILKDVLFFTKDPKLCNHYRESGNTSGNNLSCELVYSISPFYFISFVLFSQL